MRDAEVPFLKPSTFILNKLTSQSEEPKVISKSTGVKIMKSH